MKKRQKFRWKLPMRLVTWLSKLAVVPGKQLQFAFLCSCSHIVEKSADIRPSPQHPVVVALVGWNHHVGFPTWEMTSKRRALSQNMLVQTTRSVPVSDLMLWELDVFMTSSDGCSQVLRMHRHKYMQSEMRLISSIIWSALANQQLNLKFSPCLVLSACSQR